MSAITSASLHALRQSDRLHAGRRQSRTAGRAGTGARMHHFGNSMRVGVPAGYGGTIEDCLQGSRNDRLLVLRPGKHQRRLRRVRRHASGASGPRNSASNSFISTRTAIRPPSCSAAAGSRSGRTPTPLSRSPSCMSGSTKVFTTRITSRRAPPASTSGEPICLGETDGVPKTPEWQEAETGVPAQDVRALARRWGGKKVHLAVGMTRRGIRRRGTRRDRAAMGALHGHDDGHAGLGQARRQFRQSPDPAPRIDHDFYFPGLRGRRDLRRPARGPATRSTTISACRTS